MNLFTSVCPWFRSPHAPVSKSISQNEISRFYSIGISVSKVAYHLQTSSRVSLSAKISFIARPWKQLFSRGFYNNIRIISSHPVVKIYELNRQTRFYIYYSKDSRINNVQTKLFTSDKSFKRRDSHISSRNGKRDATKEIIFERYVPIQIQIPLKTTGTCGVYQGSVHSSSE